MSKYLYESQDKFFVYGKSKNSITKKFPNDLGIPYSLKDLNINVISRNIKIYKDMLSYFKLRVEDISYVESFPNYLKFYFLSKKYCIINYFSKDSFIVDLFENVIDHFKYSKEEPFYFLGIDITFLIDQDKLKEFVINKDLLPYREIDNKDYIYWMEKEYGKEWYLPYLKNRELLKFLHRYRLEDYLEDLVLKKKKFLERFNIMDIYIVSKYIFVQYRL
ncbi:MAG: hypothetical protein N2169_06510 [bacterium]|nr:hypothetical protein [bacterium]